MGSIKKKEYLLEEQDLGLVRSLSAYLRTKYNLTDGEIATLLLSGKELSVPLNIFSSELGALETIVKYLRENVGIKFQLMADMLNRSLSTVLVTYKKAREKHPEVFIVKNINENVPIAAFRERRFSTLEILVQYLSEEKNMTNAQIAVLLERDDRTIWTVLDRYKKKCRHPLR